jgi:hydroxymethylpyrimidine/phosphomethylpyrimidine kinase
VTGQVETPARLSGRVLIVGLSNSDGGGIQADLKTVLALGAHGVAALTAVAVGDTERIHALHPLPPEVAAEQMRAMLADTGADCLKIGLLADAATIAAVADVLDGEARGIPLVAEAPAADAPADLIAAFAARLLPLASLVVANAAEASALLGRAIATLDQRRQAATDLARIARAALITGGGTSDAPTGDPLADVLAHGRSISVFGGRRLRQRLPSGKSATLAAAIAAGLAQHLALPACVRRGRDYLQEAILSAPGFGRGAGPLNHAHTMRPTSPAMLDI